MKSNYPVQVLYKYSNIPPKTIRIHFFAFSTILILPNPDFMSNFNGS